MEGDMEIMEKIVIGVGKGDASLVHALTEKALSQNISAEEILNNGLVAGMNIISEKFKKLKDDQDVRLGVLIHFKKNKKIEYF